MHWIALAPISTDAHAATALGWWALQWTPRVALVEEAVLLEVSACERLWGGRSALLHKIYKQKQPLAGEMIAQAATSLIALAWLRLMPKGMHQGPPRGINHDPSQGMHKGLRQRTHALPGMPDATEAPDAPDATDATDATDALGIPDALPLHTLSAARAHLPTLERLGVRTWGALRALPRGGVARRFGAPLLEALDCAYGLRPERHVWLTLPEVFELKVELPALAETAPELMFATQRLLHALHAWLQRSAQGVLALQLEWQLDMRRVDGERVPASEQLNIRTAQATQDMSHLARLISENLGHTTLPAPAHSLSLRTLEAAPLTHYNESLLLQEKQTGDSLHQLVERLRARLGPGQVLQARSVPDHRPEYMTTWDEVQDATKLIAGYAINTPARGQKGLKTIKNMHPQTAQVPGASEAVNAAQAVEKIQTSAAPIDHAPHLLCAPTWLLRTPRRLGTRSNRPQYQGPLRLLAGPQRLEGGWWAANNPGASAARDYFVAHSTQAGLLWIYRERLPKLTAEEEPGEIRWFLHGVYA